MFPSFVRPPWYFYHTESFFFNRFELLRVRSCRWNSFSVWEYVRLTIVTGPCRTREDTTHISFYVWGEEVSIYPGPLTVPGYPTPTFPSQRMYHSDREHSRVTETRETRLRSPSYRYDREEVGPVADWYVLCRLLFVGVSESPNCVVSK